ncbi:multidrug effflux MFS transporter [Paraferrimonas sp. SM1919]|uniref:multidrug effflux MFS transporter n=1 Tax=Paraferrimonas sp. SM1919 TaxID=2662263 RepID=UPI0013D319D4|nr:multidrug effflux MFS transporter [Paraferrimonas sp. SM1919]
MQTRLLPLLMLLVLFSPLAIDIYLPSMPAMAADFAASDAAIQLTIVIFLFAMGLGQILIGPLADKFGRRPVALAGISLYAVAALIDAFSQTYEQLLIGRVLQGFAACATSIVAFSAVRDSVSAKEGGTYYSYLNGAICVVPALAPTLGGLLAIQWGWRASFVFMALFAVVIFSVIFGKFAETKAPDEKAKSQKLYAWARYQPVLSNSNFLFYALSCMAAMAAILCYVSYAPMYLIGELGISELTFTALFGFNAIINIAACFIAPIIVKRIGNVDSVRWSMLLFMGAGILQLISVKLWPASGLAFMLPMLLLCCGFALLLGPATAMALAPFAERAGTASAMLGCIQMSLAAVMVAVIQQTSLAPEQAVAFACIAPSLVFLGLMASKKLNVWHKDTTEEH